MRWDFWQTFAQGCSCGNFKEFLLTSTTEHFQKPLLWLKQVVVRSYWIIAVCSTRSVPQCAKHYTDIANHFLKGLTALKDFIDRKHILNFKSFNVKSSNIEKSGKDSSNRSMQILKLHACLNTVADILLFCIKKNSWSYIWKQKVLCHVK